MRASVRPRLGLDLIILGSLLWFAGDKCRNDNRLAMPNTERERRKMAKRKKRNKDGKSIRHVYQLELDAGLSLFNLALHFLGRA